MRTKSSNIKGWLIAIAMWVVIGLAYITAWGWHHG